MSYCRWSSDDWRCELYCYGGERGYVTHIASNKIVGDIPKADWQGFINKTISVEEFAAQDKKQMDWLETAKRKPIGLPYDGQTFEDADAASFLARLLHLREVGYKFPDYVIEAARDDVEEEKKS